MPRNRFLAIDTETTGTDFRAGHKPYSVQCCDDQGRTWYWEWPVDPFTREPRYKRADIRDLDGLLGDYSAWVFHNARFDIRALTALGSQHFTGRERDFAWEKVEDTLLQAHVLDSSEDHGLKPLARKYLDIPDTDKHELQAAIVRARRVAKSRGWPVSPVVAWDGWLPRAIDRECDLSEKYGSLDAIRTMRLFLLFSDELDIQNLRSIYERERVLLPKVYFMENVGLYVSRDRLSSQLMEYENLRDAADIKMVRQARAIGFDSLNVRSGPQLRELLHKKLKLPTAKVTIAKKTGKVSESVDRESLEKLWVWLGHRIEVSGDRYRASTRLPASKAQATEVVDSLLTFRSAQTAVGYLEGYQTALGRGSILYPSFNQTGTHTTRFSCYNPNAHNISKKASMPLRSVFGPRPGHLWFDIDYDQLELRIFAVAAEERSLIEAFARGEDIHGYVAQRIFNLPPEKITKEQRRIAKGVNFGLIYGAGKKKIDHVAGPGTYDKFKVLFPSMSAYMASTLKQAEKHGYVTTLGGYRLHTPKDRAYAGVNYIVQGTAGEILKKAILDVDEYLYRENPHLNGRIILTVHDELIVECPVERRTLVAQAIALDEIQNLMRNAGKSVGVHTPVTPGVVLEKWSDVVELKGDLTQGFESVVRERLFPKKEARRV